MGADQSLIKPVVSKKIQDINTEKEKLKTTIDSYVNRLSVECTAISDKATAQTYKDFPALFQSLEDVSVLLRQMQDKIRDSQGGACVLLETESEGKYAALLSRVEKLEAMSAATRSQCDELQQSHQANLESQTDKDKQIDKAMVKVSSLECKTDYLESELKDVEKRQSTRLNVKVQEVLKTSNARIDKNTQDISDLTWTTSIVESSHNSLVKDVDKLKADSGMEVSKLKRTRTKQRQFEVRVEEVESKIGMLCELLSTKVVYLERLRDALNQASANVAKRSDLEKECLENKKKADSLSKRLSKLEVAKKKPKIGFTAQFDCNQKLKNGHTLRGFNNVICDAGGQFHGKYGKFTVPQDGLYCFVLSMQQEDDNAFTVDFLRKSVSGEGKLMSVDVANESMYTIQGMFLLKEDDIIRMQVSGFSGNLELHESTTFSGWLIN